MFGEIEVFGHGEPTPLVAGVLFETLHMSTFLKHLSSRVMCFCSNENDMQNFRHFSKKKKKEKHFRSSLSMVLHSTLQLEDTSFVKELVEEYKDRFEGIGTVKDIQIDLEVDPDFTPVTQPPRRQPFSLQEKMKKEIQHLLDQDIIEKVNEPLGWVSSPVVSPISRRHTQNSTIDDMITELSGSTVFSHLDMSKGYHQLELKESSRNVTTFSTHIGLSQYKRLSYGTRSAAVIFQ